MVAASRDADGANLDRIQIIKGWLNANGETEEQIYDVALSDDRSANWLGNIAPVGNTVDIANASYSNSIGDPELTAVWTDPDFDQSSAPSTMQELFRFLRHAGLPMTANILGRSSTPVRQILFRIAPIHHLSGTPHDSSINSIKNGP